MNTEEGNIQDDLPFATDVRRDDKEDAFPLIDDL
jgi:hypothetical protein